MSPTDAAVPKIAPAPVPIGELLDMRELTVALIKHYGLHEGSYDLLVELQFAAGRVGPTKDTALPGAMVGISKVGLIKPETISPATVDAAEVNPAKPRRKRGAPQT